MTKPMAKVHECLATREGRVSVRWCRLLNGDSDARICIEWQEAGGPTVQAPDRFGYGMDVIRGVLPYELDGKVETWRSLRRVSGVASRYLSEQLANGHGVNREQG